MEEFVEILASAAFVILLVSGVTMVLCASVAQRKIQGHSQPRLQQVLWLSGWFVLIVGLGAFLAALIDLVGAVIAEQLYHMEGIAVAVLLFLGTLMIAVGFAEIRFLSLLSNPQASIFSAGFKRRIRILRYCGSASVLIFSAIVVAAILLLTYQILFAAYMFVAVVVVLAIPAVYLFHFADYRRARQSHLLWTLAIAVKRHLSLPREVEIYANSLYGRSQRRARELASRLREGISLGEALLHLPGLVPRTAIVAIRIGEESDTLDESLREIALRFTTNSSAKSLTTSIHVFFGYIFVVVVVSIHMLTFLMYFIVPKHKKIFADFDTELPAATMFLIKMSDIVVENWFSTPLVMVLSVLVVMAFIAMRLLFQYRTPWETLKAPWLIPRFDVPWVLRHLARTLSRDRPIETTLSAISGFHHRAVVRSCVERIYQTVVRGENCWHAFFLEKMLTKHEVSLLEYAERINNLPWSLETLANTIERQIEHRIRCWFEIVRPATILIIGLAVGITCIGMFAPLVGLINDLTAITPMHQEFISDIFLDSFIAIGNRHI